jgi:hypothetical protein
MFSKTLPHDDQGRVFPQAYRHMRKAILQRNIKLLNTVPKPGTLRLKQPLASFTSNLVGVAPSSLAMPPPPSMSSDEAAAEIVELYWLVLTRDIPFSEYDTNPLIAEAVANLNTLKDYKAITPVTPQNIFRGISKSDLVGPLVSQIMFIDTPMWPGVCPCSYYFPARTAENNRMITKDTYLSVQNGTVTEPGLTLSPEQTYLSTGRDLAYSVWNDAPGQWCQLAISRLLSIGAPYSPKNPYVYTDESTEGCGEAKIDTEAFINWYLIDVITCLEVATQVALTVAWYNKWAMFRRLRPEAYGNEVEQWRLTGENPANISSELLKNPVLAKVLEVQGNYYMAQTFPEGSPTHPAYPAGHALFAGAGITIIKAFLDNDWVFPNPVEPNADGKSVHSIDIKLTLANEANKLASNIALGRDWAGVHYRTDGHNGILLGEKVAICVLQDWLDRYPEPDVCITFISYLGDKITLRPNTKYGLELNPPNAGCRV